MSNCKILAPSHIQIHAPVPEIFFKKLFSLKVTASNPGNIYNHPSFQKTMFFYFAKVAAAIYSSNGHYIYFRRALTAIHCVYTIYAMYLTKEILYLRCYLKAYFAYITNDLITKLTISITRGVSL